MRGDGSGKDDERVSRGDAIAHRPMGRSALARLQLLSRLWVKVVVAITSPSYRALGGFGDGQPRTQPVSIRRCPRRPSGAPTRGHRDASVAGSRAGVAAGAAKASPSPPSAPPHQVVVLWLVLHAGPAGAARCTRSPPAPRGVTPITPSHPHARRPTSRAAGPTAPGAPVQGRRLSRRSFRGCAPKQSGKAHCDDQACTVEDVDDPVLDA